MSNTSPSPHQDRSFLREWASAPLRVAAIAPSSRALGRIITSEIDETTGPVIELGAGTGVFTQALLDRGVTPENLALIELSPSFADRLQRSFPELDVHNASATDVDTLGLFDGAKAGAVVSGLGLLSMPEEVVGQIIDAAFASLKPGAAFYQFTYSWQCPVNKNVMQSRGLQATRIGWTLWNLPPASVYKVTKA